jgi:hypothetical protein
VDKFAFKEVVAGLLPNFTRALHKMIQLLIIGKVRFFLTWAEKK